MIRAVSEVQRRRGVEKIGKQAKLTKINPVIVLPCAVALSNGIKSTFVMAYGPAKHCGRFNTDASAP